MIKSEPILPIRFYNNLYDQKRFNLHCQDKCLFELVYPAIDLPRFQFTRASKFQAPTKFYIRNVCDDAANDFYKMIPEGADVFGPPNIYGDFPKYFEYPGGGAGPPQQVEAINLDCGKIVSTDIGCEFGQLTGSIMVPLGFNDPFNFQFKIIIDNFYSAGTFQIRLKLDGVLVATISSAGTWIFNFTNPDLNSELEIEFYQYTCTDSFTISYMQGTVDMFAEMITGDIEMNEGALVVKPMADDRDIITFCSGNSANISPGQYYYVVVSGSDYYFSEVFTIKTAKEIEKFYRLKWWSECDLNDAIIYSSTTLSCQFSNTLYLDAGLFKPEYDTKDDGEENGQGDTNILFQRWQKNLSFEVPLSPEFLTDALSGIFLHEFVYIRKPLNYYQDVLDNEYRVLKTVPDVEDVHYDCYQKVTLKMLLADRYTDTSCCNEANVFDCTPCNYTVGDSCDGFDYALVESGAGYQIQKCSDLTNIVIKTTDIICYGGKYYMFTKDDAGDYIISKTMPNIDSIGLVFLSYILFGSVLPYSWATVQYNKDGAGWVTLDTVQGDADGDILYWIPLYLVAGTISTFKVRIHMQTLNCDFGYSDEYLLIDNES